MKIHPFHPRFICFLIGQFLGAFNDNAFKLVVALAAVAAFQDPSAQKSYLSMVSAVAILPFVLLSGYAGYVSDRYHKSQVLKISKATEIIVMLVALVVLSTGQNMILLMFTLFCLAAHSTFFSPAKYGILPEWMRPEDLPKANGYLSMLTYIAIIAGTIGGSTIWQHFKHDPKIIGIILTALAIIGTILCLFAPPTTVKNDKKKFDKNPFGEIIHAWPEIRHSKVLFSNLIGSALYWMLGALIYLSLIVLGSDELHLSESKSGSLFSFLAVGIGIGSIMAGYIVDRSIRKTLIIWGALIMGLACILCGFFAVDYISTAILITIAGIGAGWFVVPVMTLIQKNAPNKDRGQIMATFSFFDTLGVFLASGIFWLFSTKMGLLASETIMASGIIVIVSLIIAIILHPQFLHDAAESFFYWIMRRIYKIKLVGDGLQKGHFPIVTKPTVIIANHVTFIDGILLSMICPKRISFLVLSTFWKKPLTRFVLNLAGAIPFGTGGVAETRNGLNAARECLKNGGIICIFPEGVLSRTGQIFPFKRGVEKILEGLDGIDVDIIPVHLDRLWGSIFSFSKGRFLTKMPESIPYPVTISVGKPIPSTSKAWQLHQAVSELGTDSITYRFKDNETLGQRFIAKASRSGNKTIFSDTLGYKCSGRRAMIMAKLLAIFIAGKTNSKCIPILLPASVSAVLVNIAVAIMGRTSANLNFSLGADALQRTIKRLDSDVVITSKAFIKKANIAPSDDMVFIEDVKSSISPITKALTALQAFILPTSILTTRSKKDDIATLLFSSGSTGEPKIISLSHQNILANIDSIDALLQQADGGKQLSIMGSLPFFHSFGLTACLWLPATTARPVVYHPNPLDTKTIVKVIHENGCGIMVATPTFAKNYASAANNNELDCLHLLIVGGEKLTPESQEKLSAMLPKTHILQGYGCTELGPVVAVNVPDIQHNNILHRGHKIGAVGKPIPGVTVKIVNLDDDTILPPESEGRVFVKSPSQMHGYYGDTKLSNQVIVDGWYDTGDIGKLDADGFLHITDRLSRFSKIGGEMVPLIKIEDEVKKILKHDEVVVFSIPDEKKGERLAMIFIDDKMTAEMLYNELKSADILPNLWMPRADSIIKVNEIPKMANGKIDFNIVKKLIVEKLDS